MKITRTVEFDTKDRMIIEGFLKLTDKIAEAAGCNMQDVFLYFVNQAEILADGEYSITSLHQIEDIG